MKILIALAALLAVALAQGPQDPKTINPTGCGRRPYQTRNKIVGGQETAKFDWGWQIGMINRGSFSCGGSLINSQWVLTAAHCVETNPTPSNYEILIGAHNRLIPEAGHMKRKVIKIIYHSDYTSRPAPKKDVALMKLDRPVVYSNQIVPVCIDDGTLNFEGALAATTGWGTTDSGSISSIKKEVGVNIMPESKCKVGYGTNYDHKVEVCAGTDKGGKDACQGDSGGPLVVQNPLDGLWYSYGVTSWGRGCGLRGYPGIYARTATFRSWILSNIQNN